MGQGKSHRDIVQERKGKVTEVCFEIVDKRSAPACLTLKFRDRFDEIIPYKLMRRVSQIDAQHLRLVFGEEQILVKGRGMEAIMSGLSDVRVTYLREAPSRLRVDDGVGVIDQIIMGIGNSD